MFSYSSVVGMLIHISGHTSPDIAFTVNCCLRYIFRPQVSHELELKRLARYLKHTEDRGLMLDPNSDIFKVDAYPDADFAGMYGQENPDDPTCDKSLAGFIITVLLTSTKYFFFKFLKKIGKNWRLCRARQ